MIDRKVQALKEAIENGEHWEHLLLCDGPEGAETAMLQQMAKEVGREKPRLSELPPGKFKDLISQMKQGDKLEYFCSPPATWRHLCGKAGYQILRAGSVVNSVVSCVN